MDQPGGPNTTIAMTYNNCAGTTLSVAPTATASGGTITYTPASQELLPGEA